jgi:uncharacterized protein
MTTYARPGVYVQETLNPIAPVVGPSSTSVAAFIGASDRGPTTPTLITSWGQYINQFGGWNTTANNNLPLAVYLYFANGGANAYILRVPGTGATAATRSFNDLAGTPQPTLTVSANNVGAWGNNVNITIAASTLSGYFDLTVYNGGTTAGYIVEQWPQLTMNAADSRYAINVINNNSKYIAVTDLASTTAAPNNNPSAVTNQALSTGSDGAAVTGSTITSFAFGSPSPFDVITNSLDMNIPGYTDATTVNAAISYATGRQDVFVIIDGINDTAANQITLASSYTSTSQAAVYYPQITIADPTAAAGSPSGLTKTLGAGGAVAGLFASTDASRGVFKAPAGLQARIAGAISVAPLSNADLDSLNTSSAAVNAIRYIPGSGIVVFGSRTIKPGYVDRYVPVRRTLIYLEKSLKDLTRFAIFEPNDARLWNRLNAAVGTFLTSFWSQGGLTGALPTQAFFVKCDADNNTQSSVDNGYVNIQVGVALQRPAEFVVINIGQYSGGTTVSTVA